MTERQASRWAEQRKQGRFHYAICAGLFHTGRILVAMLLVQIAIRLRPSVPPAVVAAEIGIVAALSVLLEYFRWNYRELQFFLFNKAQACSAGASRA